MEDQEIIYQTQCSGGLAKCLLDQTNFLRVKYTLQGLYKACLGASSFSVLESFPLSENLEGRGL